MRKKKEETYYGKILGKHITEFIQKHEKVTDIKTVEELERTFTLALADCVNDLDMRIRKLEQLMKKEKAKE
jgi:hypothetical protein